MPSTSTTPTPAPTRLRWTTWRRENTSGPSRSTRSPRNPTPGSSFPPAPGASTTSGAAQKAPRGMAGRMGTGRQAGFTYLAALFMAAALGAGLVAVGETWSHARQREKEAELLWIGEQFRQAIALYYHR